MVRVIRCHLLNTKTNIINDSEVSGLSVAIQVDVAEGLPKARVPVLMVYGGKHQLVKVQPSLVRARELNSHIQTKIYANSGHAPFLEEAPRFNHDLSAFMKATATNGGTK